MIQVKLQDIVEEYCIQEQIKNRFEKKKILNLVKRYYELIGERVIEGEIYKPEFNYGMFGIIKKKTNRKQLDYKQTKEHGKLIYHENRHTDGNHFVFVWVKNKHRHNNIQFRNSRFYKMKAIEYFKDRISEKIFRTINDPYQANYDVPNFI